MRKTTLLWLILAVLCGAGIFRSSQRVHDEHEKIAALNTEIAKEQESLRVLNAEWSYLNQPARLEKLADTYLHLAPLKGSQFVKVEDLPLRGAAVAEAAPAAKGKKTADKKASRPHIAVAVRKKTKPSRLAAIVEKQDEHDDIDNADEAPVTRSGVKAASLARPAAGTHNFTDLMKNLRSGIE